MKYSENDEISWSNCPVTERLKLGTINEQWLLILINRVSRADNLGNIDEWRCALPIMSPQRIKIF